MVAVAADSAEASADGNGGVRVAGGEVVVAIAVAVSDWTAGLCVRTAVAAASALLYFS